MVNLLFVHTFLSHLVLNMPSLRNMPILETRLIITINSKRSNTALQNNKIKAKAS